MSNPGGNRTIGHENLELSSQSDDEDDTTFFDHPFHELGLDGYFVERDSRLFHSHGISLYPLPVDTREQQSQIVLHVILRMLIGANYVGPVPQVLAPSPERRKLVLDMGTGTGHWLLEMAREFPHVQFLGLDIVPITPLHPLPNVRSELHDINQRCRLGDNTVDLVHARFVCMTTSNYRAMLQDFIRILRPGGLFISGEWEFRAAFHPWYPPFQAPGASRFFEILVRYLRQLSLELVAPHIPAFLYGSGQFDQIDAQVYFMPIGPWHPHPLLKRVGKAFRANLVRVVEAFMPMLKGAGYSEEDLDEIYGAYLHDLRTVKGMVFIYHTVHARKRQFE